MGFVPAFAGRGEMFMAWWMPRRVLRDGHRRSGAAAVMVAMGVAAGRGGAVADYHHGGLSRSRRDGDRVLGASVEAGERLGHAVDELAVDELLLALGGVAEGGAGEPVDVAERALRDLVQGAERVVREEVALASRSA
jgi:hypothetical protein